MKRILQLALLGGMMMIVGAATAQTKVVFTWNNTATACSATVTTSCGKTQTLTDVTSLTPSIITTAILATDTTYTLTPLPTPGVHNYLLVVNGVDGVGNAVTTAGATCGTANTPPPCTITVPPPFTLPGATGFTVILK